MTTHLLIGVLFTVVMWALATWVERAHLNWGIRIREAVYGLIQTRIGGSGDKDPQVMVVDISASAPMMAGDGSGLVKPNAKLDDKAYTDRTYLRDLVFSILEQEPKAIGLDIDFTPYPAQTEDDDRLLACFLSLSTGSRIATDLLPSGGIDPLCYQTPSVPIYVATYSSIALGPLYALERPEYSTMAGFAGTVRPDSGEAPRKMVYSMSIPYGVAGGPSWQVNSLSSAVYGARADVEVPALEWAAERLPVTQTQNFRATEFYVNYGVIDDLQKNYTIDACDLIRNRKANSPTTQNACDATKPPRNSATINLKGKYVLIGRAKLTGTDEHPVPGHAKQSEYAGVYLHACAINTLSSGSLLALLLPTGRLILDLSLFFLIFALVELIRMFVRRKFGWEPSERALHIVVTLCVVAVAIVVGIYGLSRIRLMWDDSPFVGAGLIAHALIGHLPVRF
jgi:CHASE2 domain-containing sensor protein